MPSAKEYRRLIDSGKCPKCAKSKPDDGFVTCVSCRKTLTKDEQAVRASAMSLFCGPSKK